MIAFGSRPQIRPLCASQHAGHRASSGRGALCVRATTDEPAVSQPAKRFATTVRKPMGMVLADSPAGVKVDEITEGSNAYRAGLAVGDVLFECSAVVLKEGKEGQFESEGYGQRPYTNWKKVMFTCEGEDFDTIMKAIASNNERWGYFSVDLVVTRA